MSKTEEFLLLAEKEIVSERINEIELTEGSAKVRQSYNPLASEYRTHLSELAFFLKSNSHIGEIEIRHPRLGRIRLSRQGNSRKGKIDDSENDHPED